MASLLTHTGQKHRFGTLYPLVFKFLIIDCKMFIGMAVNPMRKVSWIRSQLKLPPSPILGVRHATHRGRYSGEISRSGAQFVTTAENLESSNTLNSSLLPSPSSFTTIRRGVQPVETSSPTSFKQEMQRNTRTFRYTWWTVTYLRMCVH